MKNFLLSNKSFIITLMIAIMFLFSAATSFAVVKTWAGGVGAGKDWTLAANWSGGTTPLAADDILFNTPGTITFSTMPAASIAYNSLTITAGSIVTVAGSSAITLTIGGNPDVDFVVSGGGSTFTLGTNINITLSSGSGANISGDFFINAGRNYNTDAALAVTSVFGTINNQGTLTCTSASKLLFQSGCAYVHNQNGGTIPTATWGINSFCNITGLVSTHPVGGNQAFGNLIYNCAGMTSNLIMANGVSVANAFTINNTGTARLLMTAGSFTVGGDFTLEDDFTISNATDRTLTITGNVFISGGGNLDLCMGGAGNIGTLNIGGNFTNFGAITENASGTGKGVINFNGTIDQIFNQSGALVNNVDFGINNTGGGAGVTFSASTILNASLSLTNGKLTIPTGTTLTIASGNVIGGSGFGAGKHIATLVNTGTGAKGFLRISNMAAGTPYVIPVGNGTNYLPATLTPANINGYDICVFNGITTNGEPNGTAFTAAQKDKCVDAVWTVNLVSGTAGAGVVMTLGWPATLEGTSFSSYTTTQIGISHWDNPGWGVCIGSGDNAANTSTRPGITVFSPFGVGRTPNVLPVKFSYLNAAKGNGYNTLYWKAACSSTEVTFSIERSTDGRNFNAVNSITATQARCAQPFDYMDNINLPGTVFYRIKATEITGLITYSTIVKISDRQTDMQLTVVLPNPVINQAQLNIITTKKDIVELVIVSIDGKVLQHSSVRLQAGSSIIDLDVAALQKGIYMIKGTFSNGQTNTLKFTKQ